MNGCTRFGRAAGDTPAPLFYTPGMLEILPQLLVNSLITASIYALASAGLALTFSLLRILNFAHGHIMMAGAYTFLFFRVEREMGILPAAAASATCTILLGGLTLAIFIRPFLRSSSLLPLITTIALGTILESVVSMVFGVNVRAFPTVSSGESIEWHGIFITQIQLLIIGSALAIFGALGFYVHLTSVGRRIRALAENPAAAESLGISRRKITYGVFILSMLLGTYAGILVGYETNLQPTMGSGYSIKAFAAMVLGGLGNMWGTIVGALILGLVENLSIGLDFGGYSLPAGYKDAFAFLIILAVLLLRPQGLFGTQRRST
jgi:branched-chain amino acid transport system permease protein